MVAGTAGTGRKVYRCTGAIKDGRPHALVSGPHSTRQRDKLDEYVTRVALAAINAERIEQEFDTAFALTETLEQERTEADLYVYDLERQFKAREIQQRDFLSTINAARNRRDGIERDLEAARLLLADVRNAGAARAQWDSWTVPKRRAFLRSRYSGILLNRCGRRGSAAREIHAEEVEFLSHEPVSVDVMAVAS